MKSNIKLNELKQYAKNLSDKEIINRMEKDNEENLNKYVYSVICDLIQNIHIDESLKSNVKGNLNNMKKYEFAKLCTYTSMIPYVSLKLNNRSDSYVIISSYIEGIISYSIGYMSEEEFNKLISSMNDTLNISNEFYESMVIYFEEQNEKILNLINNRL